MRTQSDPAKTLGAALALVLLATTLAALIWGVWRLLSGTLNLTLGFSIPAAILLLLSAGWVVSAVARRSLDQERNRRLFLGKAEAYKLALTGDPRAAAADMTLWATPKILHDYTVFACERARNAEAPFPRELLVAMRRDLGHTPPDLDGIDVGPLLDGSSSSPPQSVAPAHSKSGSVNAAEMKFSLRYPGTDAGSSRGKAPPHA